DPKQCRETELAIHRASHLARYADGRAAHHHTFHTFHIAARFYLVPRFAAVTALSAISLRHPDRFHRLAVGELHQIPYRAVAGNKLARNFRKPYSPALLRQASAIVERQRRNLVQPVDPLPIQRIKQLLAPVGGLPRPKRKIREFPQVKS